MRRLGTVILLTFLMGSALPAIADTDYRCLTQCVNEGTSSATCLKKCSYNIAPSPTPAPTVGAGQETLEFSHRQFAAPVPLKNGEILPPVHTNHEAPEKDYACVAKCQQEGMQYQFCEESCTKGEKTGASMAPAANSPDKP